MAGFSDVNKEMKKKLIEAIDTQVNGTLCIDLLSERITSSPASKTLPSGIRVDHTIERSGSSTCVKVQVQSRKETYATCIVHKSVLPREPDNLTDLQNFIICNKRCNLDKCASNPRKKHSDLWEAVIEVARSLGMSTRGVEELPTTPFGDEFDRYNKFFQDVRTKAETELHRLNKQYEGELFRTANQIETKLKRELIRSLDTDARSRKAVEIRKI